MVRALAAATRPILFGPAFVNRIGDNVKVFRDNAADKKDADVVFHRDQFRVVDSRLLGQSFGGIVELKSDGIEAKNGLLGETLGPAEHRMNYAMLLWFYPLLCACSTFVREDRSCRDVSGQRGCKRASSLTRKYSAPHHLRQR